MNRAPLATIALAAVLAPGAAHAQVGIVSRLSAVSAYRHDNSPNSWDEHDSFSGPGLADLLLPHRTRHTFSVLPGVFQGRFDGSYSASNFSQSGSASSLDVVFSVPLRTGIEIRLDGAVYPPTGPGALNPTENNAYYHLERTSPGPVTVIFDSFRDGSPTPPDPDLGQFWNNTVWNGTLSAGTYHLIGGASGVRVGGGGGSASGNGRLTVTTIFTPACPADFNGDGFLDFFDYSDYVACFEDGTCPPGRTADFNGDAFVDFFDYDAFLAAFQSGC